MKKSFVIIEDNYDFNMEICEALSTYADYKVLATAKNGEEGFEIITQYKPDIILMDIVMPVKDGLYILEKIKNCIDYKPMIFCISSLSNDLIINITIKYGVHYFFQKPIDINVLLKRIDFFVLSNKLSIKDYSNQTDYNLLNRIYLLLSELRIRPNLIGYNLLKLALIECYNLEEKNFFITKEIYPAIAKKIKYMDDRKIESGIRHAIDKAWNDNKTDENYLLRKYFKETTKPTNGQVIAYLTNLLRDDL